MAKQWSEEDVQKLIRLRQQGASITRASLALKWHKAAIRAKARELGIPFPHLHEERRQRLMKEAAARAQAGLPPERSGQV